MTEYGFTLFHAEVEELPSSLPAKMTILPTIHASGLVTTKVLLCSSGGGSSKSFMTEDFPVADTHDVASFDHLLYFDATYLQCFVYITVQHQNNK